MKSSSKKMSNGGPPKRPSLKKRTETYNMDTNSNLKPREFARKTRLENKSEREVSKGKATLYSTSLNKSNKMMKGGMSKKKMANGGGILDPLISPYPIKIEINTTPKKMAGRDIGKSYNPVKGNATDELAKNKGRIVKKQNKSYTKPKAKTPLPPGSATKTTGMSGNLTSRKTGGPSPKPGSAKSMVREQTFFGYSPKKSTSGKASMVKKVSGSAGASSTLNPKRDINTFQSKKARTMRKGGTMAKMSKMSYRKGGSSKSC